MYFLLSKLVGFILTPSNLIVVICVCGVVLSMTRFRRSGFAMTVCGVGLLALFGWSPVSNWLLLPLTERFPAWQGTAAPDGIIVLGGAINPELSAARNALEIDSSGERLIAMLQLAKRYPNARIVFSGGSGALLGAVAEAPVAGRLVDEFGLSGERVVLESTSRTTEENALNTRELVTPKSGERWLLVTSAWHMPRSVGLYRKAGFDVEAYPVDFRVFGWRDARKPFRQASYGIERADVAMHEWVGLLASWLNGRSAELFPKPR